MSAELATTLAAARALAADERHEMAATLAEGLDAAPVVMRESWKREFDRRMAKIKSGKMKALTIEQLEAKWAAEAELEHEGGLSMSLEFETVLAAAQALPDEQRRELVAALREGVDDAPEEPIVFRESWKREHDRRVAEYDAGLTTAMSAEEFLAQWAAKRAARG